MKKTLAILLAAVLCLGLIGCGAQPAPSTTEAPVTTVAPTEAPTEAPTTADPMEGVTAAQKYLRAIYKDAPVKTADDYVLSGVVRIGTDEYAVTWETNTEDAVPTKAEDGKTWTVVVNKSAAADTEYVLTGTVEDAAGNKLSVEFPHMLPKGAVISRYDQIVNLAYGLEDQEVTKESYRLCGVINKAEEWSEKYSNINVYITVDGMEDKPIECYRLSGEGAKDLKVGDRITVEGVMKNYKGTIEFDQGCVLVGMGEILDLAKTVEEAYTLEDGQAQAQPAVLAGKITAIVSEWSEKYSNITVNMVIGDLEDKPIQCYRLAGEGADKLAVGDEIAVVGTLKNYKGTIEFDQGCKLIPADRLVDVKNVLDLYQLEAGESFEGVKTLTGVVSSIASAWNEEKQNISVYFVVAGLEEYPVEAYSLSGEGAKDLAVGDTITVTGNLTRYKDTFEFGKGCTLDVVVKGE